jgi:D-alanyl-D-alanine carboxypeptidase
LPIASTTKIMEALVVLEKADPGEEVTVSRDASGYATPPTATSATCRATP